MGGMARGVEGDGHTAKEQAQGHLMSTKNLRACGSRMEKLNQPEQ